MPAATAASRRLRTGRAAVLADAMEALAALAASCVRSAFDADDEARASRRTAGALDAPPEVGRPDAEDAEVLAEREAADAENAMPRRRPHCRPGRGRPSTGSATTSMRRSCRSS
jgi:hypothetical protein